MASLPRSFKTAEYVARITTSPRERENHIIRSHFVNQRKFVPHKCAIHAYLPCRCTQVAIMLPFSHPVSAGLSSVVKSKKPRERLLSLSQHLHWSTRGLIRSSDRHRVKRRFHLLALAFLRSKIGSRPSRYSPEKPTDFLSPLQICNLPHLLNKHHLSLNLLH